MTFRRILFLGAIASCALLAAGADARAGYIVHDRPCFGHRCSCWRDGYIHAKFGREPC